jgi:ABC-type sulfate transport system substrate-binding protein
VQAKALVDFLFSDTAQAIFAQNGYRPVVEGVDSPYDFDRPKGLFDISQLGGWADVTAKFFDPASGVMAEVERKIGVAVG